MHTPALTDLHLTVVSPLTTAVFRYRHALPAHVTHNTSRNGRDGHSTRKGRRAHNDHTERKAGVTFLSFVGGGCTPHQTGKKFAPFAFGARLEGCFLSDQHEMTLSRVIIPIYIIRNCFWLVQTKIVLTTRPTSCLCINAGTTSIGELFLGLGP